MRVIIEQPALEIKAKLKELNIEIHGEALEVIEFEIPWWHKEYLSFLFCGSIMRLCEIIVPEIKNRQDYIRIGFGKKRQKARICEKNNELK